MCTVLVCDLETGGLDRANSEILEIGMIHADIDYLDEGKVKYKVLEEFHTLVQPTKPQRLHKEALHKNGLAMHKLMAAPTPQEVRCSMIEWWEESIEEDKMLILGHNFGMFDSHFLTRFLPSTFDKMFDYHCLDTWTLAKSLQVIGKLPEDLSLSLSDLSMFFELPHVPHKALADCYATLNIYKHLLELV